MGRSRLGSSREYRFHRIHDVFGGEAVFAHHHGSWCRRSEPRYADDGALRTDIAFPSKWGRGLDADASAHGRRQDVVAIGGWLRLEQLPRRHRDNPATDAVSGE